MGVCGVFPFDKITLRTALRMRKARERSEWDRTALLCCITANMLRGPKTKPFNISQFNPFEEQKPRGAKLNKGNVGMLKAFVKKRKVHGKQDL